MSVPSEYGVCAGSETYFYTASDRARNLLFYLITCGHFYTGSSYHITREHYSGFLLYYIAGGQLTIRYQGETVVAKAGQLALLDLSLPHEYYSEEGSEFLYLHLDGVNIRQIWETICREQGGFLFHSPRADQVRAVIFEIVCAFRDDQLPNEVRLSEKLYGALTACLEGCADDGGSLLAEDSPVYAAVQYIRKHYRDSLTLEDMARQANLSKYHFTRLFKRSCGCTPHEFLILTRLNRAKHLLTTTDLPISQVAREVGYRSVTTFSNAFADRVGISPTRFRQYPL